VINLLRRFDIEVPEDRLRLRNVAAVLVTAEVSPYLRAGGRFEVQVSALRKALDEDQSGQSYLITVPGRGYRFIGLVESSNEPALPSRLWQSSG